MLQFAEKSLTDDGKIDESEATKLAVNSGTASRAACWSTS